MRRGRLTGSKRKQQSFCDSCPSSDSNEESELSQSMSDPEETSQAGDDSSGKRTNSVTDASLVEIDATKDQVTPNDVQATEPNGSDEAGGDNTNGSDEEEILPLTYSELYRIRCNACRMCRRDACGRCTSCVDNQTNTTTQRRACRLRVCDRIDPHRKAQRLRRFEYLPCQIYFESGTKEETFQRCHSDRCFCQRRAELGGISIGIVLPDEPPTLCCLRQAMVSMGYSEDQIHSYIPKMWEDITGRDMKVDIPDHELVGKGFYTAWTDCRGQTRSVCGKIVQCQQSLDTEFLSFEVALSLPPISALVDCGGGRSIPAMFTTDEPMAWGGHVAFWKHVLLSQDALRPNPPFHFTWIAPHTRHVVEKNGVVDSIHLTVGGYRLELRARQSLIPGAGFGLFLTCHWSPPTEKKYTWILPVGHLVDLGVYAPHLSEDLKPPAVWNVKNILFSSASECWGFDPAQPERVANHMFDISDNVTGNVHSVAAQSLVVFANEITDPETETPSIQIHYDPTGAVHYVLGHSKPHEGVLEIPVGEEIELKVDYGPAYERERVRQGYPRVKGSELQSYVAISDATMDDEHFSEDIDCYSANSILECIEYLEQIRRDHPSPERLRDQFLLLLLSIGLRVGSILEEFHGFDLSDRRLCLVGFDGTFRSSTVPRLMKLLHWNCCELWKDDHSFNDSLMQRPLLKDKISKFLTPLTVEKLNRSTLLQVVADILHGRDSD